MSTLTQYFLCILSLCVITACQTTPMTDTNPASTPQPRLINYEWMSIDRWQEMHANNLKRNRAGNIDLLFFGDSLSELWLQTPLWEHYYGDINAANFGIGGDGTHNLLWRIQQGELDNVSPKVIVVLIGTNNLSLSSHSPLQTAQGIKDVVMAVEKKLPKTKILLLSLFPRGQFSNDPLRLAVEQVNQHIKDLGERPQVTLLNIGKAFLSADGSISSEIMHDFLHLSDKGYRIWAEQMNPVLFELMKRP